MYIAVKLFTLKGCIMKIIKKLSIAMLSAVLCLILFASCDGNETEKNVLAYELINNGQAYRVGWVGTFEGTDIVIPDTYNGKPVTEIGYSAFGDDPVTSLKIGNNVTFIDGYAFVRCASMTSVEFGNSVAEIGEQAFAYCDNLTEIKLPDSLNKIGDAVFWCNKNLKTVTVGGGLETVSSEAFAYCESLENVTLGDGVKEIGYQAFIGCTSLKSIVIPDSVTKIDREAFKDCTSLESIVIPKSVTEIGSGILEGCVNLNEITVPFLGAKSGANEDARLHWLFEDSYSSVQLKRVSLTDCSYLAASAFSGSKMLESISIYGNVTCIGEGAFCDCVSLTDIYFNGTKEEWDAVDKALNWNIDMPEECIIHFTSDK